MPLADLIRQFNREASQREGDAAALGVLLADADGAAARVDGWLLGSRFAAVIDPQRQHVVGHEARLSIDSQPATLDTLLATLDQQAQIVASDRLIRTLHSLNFLAQRQATGGFLYLDVHPRHLLSVASHHGLVFEAILKRCGLSPDDIVLQIDAAALTRPGVAAALDNYRQRGYGLALVVGADAVLPPALAVDLLKAPVSLPATALQALATAAARGGRTFAIAGVADAEQLEKARATGADLIFTAAAPAFCFPTHQPLSLQDILRPHPEGETP